MKKEIKKPESLEKQKFKEEYETIDKIKEKTDNSETKNQIKKPETLEELKENKRKYIRDLEIKMEKENQELMEERAKTAQMKTEAIKKETEMKKAQMEKSELEKFQNRMKKGPIKNFMEDNEILIKTTVTGAAIGALYGIIINVLKHE